MIKHLPKVTICGKLVEPLVEGGKGVGATNGVSSGSWAGCGGVGTFSATAADFYDTEGKPVLYSFKSEDRGGRCIETIEHDVTGGVTQAQIAHSISDGQGAILMNMLWECSKVPEKLAGILAKASDIIDGVVCGAGLPFDLAKITSTYNTYYVPIVSSELAFRILWQRSFHQYREWLGAVVYEDPWIAGGHNGISSREDPAKPEPPLDRLLALRNRMNEYGLTETAIIIAGGVWNLAEWSDYIELPELQPIAFQFGTRPLLTKESPISAEWKKRLYNIPKGGVKLHKFSPTGFYSSAINNEFLQELYQQLDREVPFSNIQNEDFVEPFLFGRRNVFLKQGALQKVCSWQELGYTDPMKTPSGTLIFVTQERRRQILADQVACIGCLNRCVFSNWDQHRGSTGVSPDPRSFCISKTLIDIAHGGSFEHNLAFAGTNVYRFSTDPFYKNNYIPTVAELFQRIKDEYCLQQQNDD